MRKTAKAVLTKIIFAFLIFFLAGILGPFLFMRTTTVSIEGGNMQAKIQTPPIFEQATNTNKQTVPKTTVSQKTFQPSGQLLVHLFDIKGLVSPKGAAISPNGKEIWVTSLLNAKTGVYVLDAKTGGSIKNINLNGGGGVEVIFSKDGAKAYVSQMETNQVFEIDAKTKEILRVFNTKGAWTKILLLSPDGKKLYASNWVDDNVSEFDLKEGKLLRLIQTIDTPRGLYITPAGENLYVAGFGYGEIQKIDLATGKGQVIFKSGGAMRHFAVDQERGILFASDMGMNAIYKVDLSDDSVTKFADTDLNANTIALSPDKKVLFVSCRGKNYSATNYSIPGPEWGSVLIFDVRTGKMLDAIVGGNQPTALDISLDGKLLVFSDFLDGHLELFGIPSYEELLSGGGGRSAVYKSELIK